jgi:DNA-binding MarR family transcriptional regulator
MKLSTAQFRALQRCKSEPWSGSNTNATMIALEKRGLVTGEPHPRMTLCLMWTITDAGREWLEKNRG